jgi:cysteine desulfurase
VAASAVEHGAVLEPLRAAEAAGLAEVSLIPVNGDGVVDLAALDALLAAGLDLVAVTAAQNEVGTLQPLEQVGARCRAAQVPLLVDATQAAARVPLDWPRLPWDALVISGHKMRAPRGGAALVHREGFPEPRPLLLGGGQELGRRAGTEAVAPWVALGEACRLIQAGELLDPQALLERRDRFEALLKERLPSARILAQNAPRLPQTTALVFPGCPKDSEALLAGLDLAGVHASSGSACSSGALRPSHVLAAMSVPEADARARLRVSFGPETSDEDLDQAIDALARLVGGAD